MSKKTVVFKISRVIVNIKLRLLQIYSINMKLMK